MHIRPARRLCKTNIRVFVAIVFVNKFYPPIGWKNVHTGFGQSGGRICFRLENNEYVFHTQLPPGQMMMRLKISAKMHNIKRL